MKSKKLELIKSFVLASIAITCMIFATYSWFVMTKTVSFEPVQILSAASSKLEAELYIKNGSVYDRIFKLEYTKMVPFEDVEYKLILRNKGTGSKNSSISFLNITEAPENGSIKLSDKLILKSVIAQGANVITPLPSSFSTLMGIEDHFTLVNNITTSEESFSEIFFTVSLDQSAGNEYQNKKITIGQLNIVHD
jgi:hypothetical protein